MLGFGSIEKEFENAEERAFIEFCDEAKSDADRYVTDELVASVTDFIKKRELELDKKYRAYRSAEHFPDRYSTFHSRIANTASDIVVIVNFMHINRKHSLSPDGWAAMTSKRIFHWEYE